MPAPRDRTDQESDLDAAYGDHAGQPCRYPVGARVRMSWPGTGIPLGMLGTVVAVDGEMAVVRWDSGISSTVGSIDVGVPR